MRTTLRSRRWQHDALAAFLAAFRAALDADFLAVATPGAGKTRFALARCCPSSPGGAGASWS